MCSLKFLPPRAAAIFRRVLIRRSADVMGLEFKLTDRELPISPVFIRFSGASHLRSTLRSGELG